MAVASLGLYMSLAFSTHAQIISSAQGSTNIACTSLDYNLRYGQYDLSAVTALQVYLNATGYMQYPATGYFGSLTYRAVVAFQNANGLPATGFVGPLTRAQIQNLSCGTTPSPNPTPNPSGVSIFNMTPQSGPVGTTVTLTGRWFTDSNMIHFGNGVIANVPSSGGIAISCTTDPSCIPGIRQTITFTIPSSVGPYCPPGAMCPMYLQLLTPGTYPVYVTNANGTSNTMTFTVTGGTSAPLSINGIDAPNSLPVGVPGTWTIHVASAMTGTLHYSAVWGDEVYMGAGIVAPQATTTQTSATFTHAYTRTGTYNANFTVSDDFGHTATTSATIMITPIY